MEIGMDLGMEGIAEDGGEGRTLSEIHRRSVSNSLTQLRHKHCIASRQVCTALYSFVSLNFK